MHIIAHSDISARQTGHLFTDIVFSSGTGVEAEGFPGGGEGMVSFCFSPGRFFFFIMALFFSAFSSRSFCFFL
jgi:hypothetical protein